MVLKEETRRPAGLSGALRGEERMTVKGWGTERMRVRTVSVRGESGEWPGNN